MVRYYVVLARNLRSLMENKLTFNEVLHQYILDGVILPSVTEVLKGVGIIDFSMVPASILDRACKFGTAVHMTTELSDRGILDEETLDPNLKPYLAGWRLFRQEYGFIPTHIEGRIFSKIYRVAGTPDRVGSWNIDDSIIIPDIKTSFELYPANAIQLAAYEMMYKEITKPKVKVKRLSVLLDDKGAYKVNEWKDKNDLNIFIAALSVYNWKGKHGK